MKKRNVRFPLSRDAVLDALACLVAWSLASDRDPHGKYNPSRRELDDAMMSAMHTVDGDIEQLVRDICG